MKRIKKILITILAMIILPNVVSAASGQISVNSTSTVVQGNKVTVTVTLSSNTLIGSWQMDLNYDKNYLQLVSSSAEAGGTMMVDSSAGGTKSKSYTFSFKALKTGSTRVSVGSYLAYAYNDLSSMSLTSSSKTIRIMTQQELEATYSKDNNLKSLSVEGYELDKTFDKDTLEYNITAPTGTTTVKVLATASDKTASISGLGEIEVTEGSNTVPIVVTAQNGDQKTYTIIVNVEDQNPINVKVDNKDYVVVKNASLLEAPITFIDTKININNYEIPAFTNDNANLTLVGLKDEIGNVSLYIYDNGKYSKFNELHLDTILLIPVAFDKELDFIKTNVTINESEIEAYKYSEDTEFVIINAKNLEDGKVSLYLYDTVKNTAIRYDEKYLNETNETIKNYTYIIITFAGALLFLLIIIFCLLHSLKKKQKKINKFIERQEAKIEATRKLNDVVAEVKKITEKEQTKEETKEEQIIEEPKQTEDEQTKTAEDQLSLTQMISEISADKEINKEKELTKKELKKLKKEQKKKQKEEFFKEEYPEKIEIKEIQVSEPDPNNEIKKVLDDSEEVYDLFGDDKKKKKK